MESKDSMIFSGLSGFFSALLGRGPDKRIERIIKSFGNAFIFAMNTLASFTSFLKTLQALDILLIEF